jgi:hypothetical protein
VPAVTRNLVLGTLVAILPFGGMRVIDIDAPGAGASAATASIDFYNMLNVSTTLAQNNTFGPAWLQPTTIMPARLAKVSLQFDF